MNNPKLFSVCVTVLFVVSVLLVSFTPITVGLTTEDKEYIDFFNRQYDILLGDIKEVERAYRAGQIDSYTESLDKLVEDADNSLWAVYSSDISKELWEVDYELDEAISDFGWAKWEADYATSKTIVARHHSIETSFENFEKGVAHLENAKSLVPERKIPGFSMALAMAVLISIAYSMQRKRR